MPWQDGTSGKVVGLNPCFGKMSFVFAQLLYNRGIAAHKTGSLLLAD